LSVVNLSQNASACECKEPDSPLSTLAKSTAVFSGKVVELTKNPSDFTKTVKFDVHRTWKGVSEKELDVVTAIDDGGCGYNFVIGETYLVYASGTDVLHTSSCGRNKLFTDAFEDLAQLGGGTIINEDTPQHKTKIENIGGELFLVSESLNKEPESEKNIRINNVSFTPPSSTVPPVPGGLVFTKITFSDGVQETLSRVGAPEPFTIFTEHKNPQAGFRRNTEGTFSFLISVEKQDISPLKQFKLGVAAGDVKCKEGFMLVIKAHDGSPACVKPLTYNKLAERGWANLLGPQMIFYVFADGKLSVIRAAENSEIVQDASKRAQFVPVSVTVLDKNPKLSEAMKGADANHDVLARMSNLIEAKPVNDVFEVKITEEEANALTRDIVPLSVKQQSHDNIVLKDHQMMIQVDGKFYVITMTTVYKQ